MPIRILSLPVSDLQYALKCMDIADLIAFSLCSKRTKNLVKSSNRKIGSINAVVNENRICVRIVTKKYHELHDDPDPQNNEFVAFNVYGSWTELGSRFGPSIRRKQKYTQSEWFAHFLIIFNESMIRKLSIEKANLSYLDTVKQLIPKCQILEITRRCSDDVANMAFSKLSHIAVERVDIDNSLFANKNDISQFLTLNLKSVCFTGRPNRFELKLDDLLMSNITTINFFMILNITEKEINRFLKLWMKGNHRFYRTEVITMVLRNVPNREEVFKGIKHEVVPNFEDVSRLKRKDGKELTIFTSQNLVVFNFH